MSSCWNKAQQFTTYNGRKTSNRTSHVQRNHLIYQTILLNDIKEGLEAPKEVYDFIPGNESFSRSGDEYMII